MKQFKLRGMVLGLLFSVSSTAFAIPMSTTGGADELVAWDDTQNNDDREQLVADYLSMDVSLINLYTYPLSGGEDAGAWQQVDGSSNLWAFDLGFEPFLFLIKTGNDLELGGSGPYNTFLYLNNGTGGTLADQYGVIDLSPFTRDGRTVEIGVVSHVSVPEPGALLLLGSSLLGFGLSRRRRRV